MPQPSKFRVLRVASAAPSDAGLESSEMTSESGSKPPAVTAVIAP
jgi:hypothetical protein